MRWLAAVLIVIVHALPAIGASLVVLDGGSAAVVGTYDGSLQLWTKGATAPAWALKLDGIGIGARSPLAAISETPSGKILVVERGGQLLIVSKSGQITQVKRPIHGAFWLRVPFDKINWSSWYKQVERMSETSAAWVSKPGASLLVAANNSPIRRFSVDTLFSSQAETAFLTNNFDIYPKDMLGVCINKTMNIDPIRKEGQWLPFDGTKEVTAIASCRATIIAGSEDGTVAFIPEQAGRDIDRRLRQLATEGDGPRSVLDAGCLRDDLAFTISFEAGNGQIQLWKLSSQELLSSVGSDTNGHPGMAFVGVPSRNGSMLMSLGDHDVRLWAVDEGKLNLKQKHFFEPAEEMSFAGAALPDGDFVYWDGGRIWLIPTSGADPILFAGKPTP